jgi:DNA-binding protein HU-beta
MMEHAVTKTDLVERLAEEHELTKVFARELVDNIFAMITEAAQKGEEVALFGFGKFKVAERGARKGRNPRTGEAVKIAASKNLKFTAARSLKAGLNTKRRARKSA